MSRATLALFATGAALACGGGIKPTATITAPDSADQVLMHMSHYVTTNGVVNARVESDTAYMYSASATAYLRGVHVTFFDDKGVQTSVLTSHEGTDWWRTGEMEARGNVVVVTTDGRTLHTAMMHYSQNRNEVTSDSAFTFDGPDRHVVGDGFTSDPSFKNVVARRPRGAGGQFTLPNQ